MQCDQAHPKTGLIVLKDAVTDVATTPLIVRLTNLGVVWLHLRNTNMALLDNVKFSSEIR